MLSCSDTVKEDCHYIRLDQAVCSFYSEGNQPIEIRIQASPSSWEAVTDASWLEAVRNEDGTILTITAADNESESERTATISIRAGDAFQKIEVNQLGMYESIPRYRTITDFVYTAAMSPNGRYVGGFRDSLVVESESSYYWTFHPTIIDLYTGEETVCMDIHQDLLKLNFTMAVSDAGYVFVNNDEEGCQYAFGLDGDYFKVEGLQGGTGKVQATSSDGKWVGFTEKEDGLYHPLVWINGQAQELKLPEHSFRGKEFVTGVMARGISADGSVIYGTTWDNMDFGMVYWTDINAEAQYVGQDIYTYEDVEITDIDGYTYTTTLATGMIAWAETTKISPSGTWIAGRYRSEKLNADGTYVETETFPAFYNTETKKTTIVRDYGDVTGKHVTDDGIAFIGLGVDHISDGVVYDLVANTPLGSTAEWVLDNYGISIPNGYIEYLSPDKRSMLGIFAWVDAMGMQYASWYIAPPLE